MYVTYTRCCIDCATSVTVVDWCNLCREVCTTYLQQHPVELRGFQEEGEVPYRCLQEWTVGIWYGRKEQWKTVPHTSAGIEHKDTVAHCIKNNSTGDSNCD
uniref:Uncharacterized protein LOC114344787 n=1 Tax=Diabrotica virgifera virgifera TaxID=50390 RepID=A0A6P7GP87_DIAVI